MNLKNLVEKKVKNCYLIVTDINANPALDYFLFVKSFFDPKKNAYMHLKKPGWALNLEDMKPMSLTLNLDILKDDLGRMQQELESLQNRLKDKGNKLSSIFIIVPEVITKKENWSKRMMTQRHKFMSQQIVTKVMPVCIELKKIIFSFVITYIAKEEKENYEMSDIIDFLYDAVQIEPAEIEK